MDDGKESMAVLITRRGKPVKIVRETATGISKRCARTFCRTFNGSQYGALRRQGLKAVAVAVW